MDLLVTVDLCSANSIHQCDKVYEVYKNIKAYCFFWTKELPSKVLFEHRHTFK